MTQDYQSRFAQKMTEEQKQIFADKVFEAKKNDPSITWHAALNAGRAAFPDIVTIPVQVINPSSYPWLMRELKNRCAQTGHDIFAKIQPANNKPVENKPAEIIAEPALPTIPKRKSNFVKKLFTPEEKLLFAKFCYQERKANPKLTWNEIFKQVNARMPEGRTIGSTHNGIAQIAWLPPLLEKLKVEDYLAEINKDKIVEPAADIPPASPEVVEKEIVREDAVKENPAPDTGMQSLESALIHAIVSTVKPIVLNIINSPQFSNSLIAAFRDMQPMRTEPSHPIVTEALKPVQKDAKPRVLIVGLLNQQAQEIQKEWSEIYDLRIYDSDVTSEKIRSILPHCDKAILMTKFVSHRAQDAMRGCSGFTYCNGGVSALKELLNRRNGH